MLPAAPAKWRLRSGVSGVKKPDSNRRLWHMCWACKELYKYRKSLGMWWLGNRILCESWLYSHPVQIVIDWLCHFNAWFPQSKEICKSALPAAGTFGKQDVGIFFPSSVLLPKTTLVCSAHLSSHPLPCGACELQWQRDARLHTRSASPVPLLC